MKNIFEHKKTPATFGVTSVIKILNCLFWNGIIILTNMSLQVNLYV